jgi:short-subunit dehydrogenase
MENKTVLITGTSSGLGYALAKHYSSKNGYNVIGLSRTNVEMPNYTHYSCDISDFNSVSKVFNYINNKIDLLINNAAVFSMSKFTQDSINNIDTIIDTNLKGSMYVTKLALELMPNNSKIVFINSVAGLSELENQSIYCASKYGLTAFAGVLGKELQTRGIKVSSIHPGGINTPLWNENNPYPAGQVANAMDPMAIVGMVDHIVSSKYNIDYKTVKLFPSIEWH